MATSSDQEPPGSKENPMSRCCILLFGASGAGKSSTINHLFSLDENSKIQALTSDTKNATAETAEYILENEAAHTSVSLIDTPGFGDVRGGLKQDACNLYSVERFLEDTELNGKQPDLIFLIFPATDVRFDGPTSQFSKILKCLYSLNIDCLKKGKLVVILTKCCSVRPDYGRFSVEWKGKIRELQNKMHDIIFQYFHISCPIVILENRYDDNEGGERLEIESRNGVHGDFSILPNGEKQPLNLIEECRPLLFDNESAKLAFSELFRGDKKVKLRQGKTIRANNASEEGYELSDHENNLLDIIQHISVETAKNTEIEKSMNFININNLCGEAKREIQEIMAFVLGFPQSQSDNFPLENIPLTVGSLELQMNKKMSDLGRKFLTEELNIPDQKVDLLDQRFVWESGYDILRDRFAEPIFQYEYENSQFGLVIPNDFDLKKVGMREMFVVYDHSPNSNTREKIQFHLQKKHVEFESFDEFKFAALPLDSHRQLIRLNNYPNNMDNTSNAIFELRLIKVVRKDGIQKQHIRQSFIEDVHNLPAEYSEETESSYHDFLKTYGSYYVKQFYCGGIKEQKVKKGKKMGYSEEPVEKGIIWIQNCVSEPQYLLNELYIQSIAEIVKIIDENKANNVTQATESYNTGQIRTRTPPTEDSKPFTREEEYQNWNKYAGFITAVGAILAIFLSRR